MLITQFINSHYEDFELQLFYQILKELFFFENFKSFIIDSMHLMQFNFVLLVMYFKHLITIIIENHEINLLFDEFVNDMY